MTSGKVRSPVTFDFPVTDASFLIYAHNMPVECPFGSDMDVKTVPSGDFKEHSSRDPFPVQEFLFLFIEQPLLAWLLSKLGLVTKTFFRKYRKHAVVVLLVLSAVITPTGDPFTLMIVFLPLYLLYELSIKIVRA